MDSGGTQIATHLSKVARLPDSGWRVCGSKGILLADALNTGAETADSAIVNERPQHCLPGE